MDPYHNIYNVRILINDCQAKKVKNGVRVKNENRSK